MAKNKEKPTAERSLLDAWTPPENAGAPIAAIATTFTFDPRLWELHLLPRFLGMEMDALEEVDPFWIERESRLLDSYAAVLVDASSASPNPISPYWDQIAVFVKGGILHSKIALLQWQNCVRLIVGSANLTEMGYRYNYEIFYALDFWDDAESEPVALLEGFIEALARIATHAPAGNEDLAKGPARERLVQRLVDCRAQVSRWKAIPADYTPRAEIKLLPILIEPGRPDIFAQLGTAWGSHKADLVWVISPFWDAPQVSPNPPAQALSAYMRRNSTLYLAAPGEWIQPEILAKVVIPDTVLEALKSRLGEWTVSPVVNAANLGKETLNRSLHAKAMLLHDTQGQMHIFYAGSSNFTSRGTGLHPGNFEAGIALVRRGWDQTDLTGLFPGTSSQYELGPGHVQFAIASEVLEDEPAGEFACPPFALYVDYDAARQNLRLNIEAETTLPAHEVSVCFGLTTSTELVLTYPPEGANPYPRTLPVKQIPTAVQLEWVDGKGTLRRVWFPINVLERSALPQPEALRDVSLNDLIAYLSSTRPAWQLFARKPKAGGKGDDPSPALDPHKLVDIRHFLTTQVKLFSKALTGLRRRFEAFPIVNNDGLQARFVGPFGPWALLKAICRECNLEIDEQGDEPTIRRPAETASAPLDLAAFLAAELALSLDQIRLTTIYHGQHLEEIKREWQRLTGRVQALAQQLAQLEGTSESVRLYTQAVVDAKETE